MKTRDFLWGLLACAAFSACSSDEVVDNTKEFKDKAYMRVQIAMAGDPYSRGTGSDYEYGESDEQPVNNLLFMFYNTDNSFAAEGKSVTEGIEVSGNTSVSGTPDGNIEAVTKPVISLQLEEGAPLPTKVVAFVNVGGSTDIINVLKDKSLTEVQAVLTSENNTLKVGDFPMSSSTYVNSDVVQIATDVPEGCFYETEEAALNANDDKIVTIHVERLPVKVKVVEPSVDKIENVETSNGKYLKFNLTGFALNATNPTSYLLKNVDAAWKSAGNIPNTNETTTTNAWADWTKPSDFRCFWAKDVNYDVASIPNLSFVKGTELNANKEPKYCYENTMTLPLAEGANLYQHATHVLVYGNYSVVDVNGNEVDGYKNDDGTIKDLFTYTGSLYLADDLKKLWADDIKDIYVKDGETYKKAGPNDYSLVSDGTVEGVILGFIEGTEYFTDETGNTEITDLDVKKAALAEIYKATGFRAGLAYFPVLIEHFGITNDTSEGPNKYDMTTELGVVRNHIYEITINKIEGLGEGIFNLDEEIIPDSSKKIWYLASKLNILSWKTVSQKVDL